MLLALIARHPHAVEDALRKAIIDMDGRSGGIEWVVNERAGDTTPGGSGSPGCTNNTGGLG